MNSLTAALRIFGDDLVPDEVSRLLDHFPTRAWLKGEQFLTSSGKSLVKKSGAWILEAEPSDVAGLDERIVRLLAPLDAGAEVWCSLAQRFEIDIFCGWFMNNTNEGMSVSAQTLLMLGERGITLSVDCYSPSSEE